MKYSSYLEQFIGKTGKLYVDFENGTYEFEISDKVSFLEKKYMLINTGEDFVVLAKGQDTLEVKPNKYDQIVIPLQRFLVSIPKSGR